MGRIQGVFTHYEITSSELLEALQHLLTFAHERCSQAMYLNTVDSSAHVDVVDIVWLKLFRPAWRLYAVVKSSLHSSILQSHLVHERRLTGGRNVKDT
jgi:hypothetical protein